MMSVPELQRRRETLCSLVSVKTVISYDELMNGLLFTDENTLEEFLIDAIYDGVIDGQLDPHHRQLDVTDFSDTTVSKDEVPNMLSTLNNWIFYTEQFRDNVDNFISDSDANLVFRMSHQRDIEELVTQNKEMNRQTEVPCENVKPSDGPNFAKRLRSRIKRN